MSSRYRSEVRIMLSAAVASTLLVAAGWARPASAQGGQEPNPHPPAGAQGEYQGPSTEFQAPDRSFSCRVPAGWKPNVVMTGGQPVLQLAPEDGGDRGIRALWTIATAASIEELVEGEIRGWASRGVALVEPPQFTQVDGAPAAEMVLGGTLPNGAEVRLWAGRILKGQFLFVVEGIAPAAAASTTQEHSRFLFRSMRLGEIPENQELAAAIAGRWSRLEKRSADNWILHRWLFDPSGRYAFQGISDYRGNSVEHREIGTYKVYGSLLLVVPDQEKAGVYVLELDAPNGLQIGGYLYHRE